jgi:lipoprotein-anchoring transpeptidase ErfK/SrfK
MIPSSARIVGGMPAIAAAFAVAALLPSATTLSDEWSKSTWAHPVASAPVRSAPTGKARTIARLHAKTEMKSPEVYLMLSQQTDSKRRLWVRIRLPGQPNGRTGWVRRTTLGEAHITRTALLVDKHALKATLYKDGNPTWSAPIGIGTRTTPTPAGRFYVRELIKMNPGNGAYGPYIYGTSGYAKLSEFPGGGIIGIHGTSAPGLIPGRPSHGCVRLRNADLLKLQKLLPVGAPVRIRN